jgi:hypothetical protein
MPLTLELSQQYIIIYTSLELEFRNQLLYYIHFWLFCSQPISGQDKQMLRQYSSSPNNAKPNVSHSLLIPDHIY